MAIAKVPKSATFFSRKYGGRSPDGCRKVVNEFRRRWEEMEKHRVLEKEAENEVCNHEREFGDWEADLVERESDLGGGKETLFLLESTSAEGTQEEIRVKLLFLNGAINLKEEGSRCLFAPALPGLAFNPNCRVAITNRSDRPYPRILTEELFSALGFSDGHLDVLAKPICTSCWSHAWREVRGQEKKSVGRPVKRRKLPSEENLDLEEEGGQDDPQGLPEKILKELNKAQAFLQREMKKALEEEMKILREKEENEDLSEEERGEARKRRREWEEAEELEEGTFGAILLHRKMEREREKARKMRENFVLAALWKKIETLKESIKELERKISKN